MYQSMIGKIKEFCLRRSCRLFAAAIFFASFALYALTASHTIFTNDNPEFTAAAAIAGIPHPSGYPLYVILAWLFAKLPFGTIPYRVNLFSALCASASLVIGYYILRRVIRAIDQQRRSPDFAVAALILPFAATGMFWFQAIVAKTYSLNLLLTLAAALLAVRFYEERKLRDLYLFALVAGLGIADHLMFALTLPFFAAMMLVKKVWNVKTFIICLGLFVLGLAPYAYIPIRSAAHPPLDWAHAVDWRLFWAFVSRAQYDDMGVGSLRDKLSFLSFFSIGVFEQFSWALVLLPVGFIWTFKKAKRWCYVLSAILFSNVIGIIGLRSSVFNYANVAFNGSYYLPSYIAVFIFCAIGSWFVFRYLKKFAAPAAAIVCLLAAGAFFIKNSPANDLHRFRFVDDRSRETLLRLPPRAVFIVYSGNLAGDTNTFSIMYQRYVNKLRPDISIVGFPSTFRQIDGVAVISALALKDMYARRGALYAYAQKNYPDRPIYATFPFYICSEGGQTCALPSVNGLAYGPSNLPAAPSKIILSENDRSVLDQDLFGQQYLADYYFQQAAMALENKDENGSMAALKMAIKESPSPNDQQLSDFMQFMAIFKRNSQVASPPLPKTKK